MTHESRAQAVYVTDIKMSFWSMVVFMVKWTIAAIPAFIILTVFAAVAVAVVTGLVEGLGGL